MAFGLQDIADTQYKELDKMRKLVGTDYHLKGEISISTINKEEGVKQKLIVYYSEDITDIVSVPGLPTHRTFLQGKAYAEMKADLKLFEQIKTDERVTGRVNFGADECKIELHSNQEDR